MGSNAGNQTHEPGLEIMRAFHPMLVLLVFQDIFVAMSDQLQTIVCHTEKNSQKNSLGAVFW